MPKVAFLIVLLFVLVPASAAAAPVARVTVAPDPVVAGETATFDAGSSWCDAAPCSYRWFHPEEFDLDGRWDTTASFTYSHVDGPDEQHSVTLRVRNARGQASSVTRDFRVVAAAPEPSPTASPTDTPQPIESPTPAATETPSPPAETPVPTETPPPAASNCMPDPSACGYPDVETTGVDPLIPRQAVGSVTLSTDGQVFQDKTVSGSIVVTGRNVTIRNVKLVCRDPYYCVSVKPGGSWEGDTAGLVLDHVEIDLGGGTSGKGIAFDGYTLRSTFIHNGSDCAHFEVNVTIEDSLCVVGPDVDGDGWPDSTGFCGGTDHFDGYQSDGGHDDVIRHNTVRNPCQQVSDVLLSSNTLPISSVTVDGNLFAGGGFSLYCAGSSDRSRVSNIVATGNRFARTFYPTGGYWGPTTYCEFASVWSGNVWDDTGLPVR